MRLTRSEIDTARDLGMTPEEYAKNKSLLIKEKRYGN
jgi:phage I-like protein